MRMLHNPVVRQEMETRLAALRPDSPRKWGMMTSDQMLWHVNQFLGWSLGENQPAGVRRGAFANALMKWFLVYMPWPKGAPTNPNAKCSDQKYDFESERAKTKALIGRLVSKPVESHWPDDPSFGPANGLFVSRLQAKHLDHHFRQFGG